MAQSISTTCPRDELERGSEEILLSEAKYKLVGKIVLDLKPSAFVTQLSRLSKVDLLVVMNADRYRTDSWCLKKVSTSGKVLREFCNFLTEPEIAVVSTDEFLVVHLKELYYCHGNNRLHNVETFTGNIGCSCLGYVDNHLFYVRQNKEIVIRIFNGKPRGRTSQTHVSTAINHASTAKLYANGVMENGTGVIYISGPVSLNANQITKLSLTGEVMMVYNDLRFPASWPIAATGDGHLFVGLEGCIKIIVPEMDRSVTVLDSKDGVYNTVALCYCPEQKLLYVGNDGSEEIMVFGVN